MNELPLALAVIGGLVLGLGLMSCMLERMPLSAPLVALLLGVALGPQALDLLHPGRWGDIHLIVEESARLTIAIGLMATALRLPPDFLPREWRSLAVVLLLVMPLAALVAGLLAWWVVGLTFLLACVAGAILCSTDPIVATSIVTGAVAERSLPQRMRHLMLGESGANDGLAFVLVWLPLLLMTHGAGAAWSQWLTHTLLWQVGGALAVGALLGHGAGRLLMLAERRHTIEITSYFAYTIALTLLTLGAAELAHTDGILAVFAAGIAFGRAVGGHERREEERVQEAINGFFTLPIFVLIGLVIPWDDWRELGWTGAAFAVLVLLLRRLPAMLLLRPLVPALDGTRDALYAGWFGPIGIAALFFGTVAVQHTGEDLLWTLTTLAICASVLAHGVTGPPLTLLYARSARGPDARAVSRRRAQA